MNKYIILSHKNPSQLEQLVNQYMDQGYVPIGGVAIETYSSSMERDSSSYESSGNTYNIDSSAYFYQSMQYNPSNQQIINKKVKKAVDAFIADFESKRKDNIESDNQECK